MNEKDTLKRWTLEAENLLKGLTVTRVRYMSDDEVEHFGWDYKGVVIQFDNGLAIFPSSDDEGNSAGSLFTTDDVLPVIPVI